MKNLILTSIFLILTLNLIGCANASEVSYWDYESPLALCIEEVELQYEDEEDVIEELTIECIKEVEA